jgi:hypothetical protein
MHRLGSVSCAPTTCPRPARSSEHKVSRDNRSFEPVLFIAASIKGPYFSKIARGRFATRRRPSRCRRRSARMAPAPLQSHGTGRFQHEHSASGERTRAPVDPRSWPATVPCPAGIRGAGAPGWRTHLNEWFAQVFTRTGFVWTEALKAPLPALCGRLSRPAPVQG